MKIFDATAIIAFLSEMECPEGLELLSEHYKLIIPQGVADEIPTRFCRFGCLLADRRPQRRLGHNCGSFPGMPSPVVPIPQSARRIERTNDDAPK